MAVVAVVATIGAYAAFRWSSRSGRAASTAEQSARPGLGQSLLVEGDDPLAGGRQVPVGVVTALIRSCNCPQLPTSGPLSPEHIDVAWLDATPQFMLEYDNGIELFYAPDEGGEAQFLADTQETIAEGAPFSIVPLRSTQGSAAERDDRGPASVTWIEGPYSLAMLGNGGQSLSEVIQLAESLPAASG